MQSPHPEYVSRENQVKEIILPTNGPIVIPIAYVHIRRIPITAMDGLILFPERPFKFDIFFFNQSQRTGKSTLTMTLYLSQPMTIIVMIEATPNKAPVKAYNLHPCKYKHYQKIVTILLFTQRTPHPVSLCKNIDDDRWGLDKKANHFYQHKIIALT